MTVDLVIVGAGGHGREMADIAVATGRWGRIGIADRDVSLRGVVEAQGHTFLAGEEGIGPGTRVALGLGLVQVRATAAVRMDQLGAEPVELIHPTATVGSRASFGRGVVLFPGARVTTNVTLGDHVHVDVNASVSHDCVVGDGSTVSPGAVVAGTCEIGVGVLVGAGAVIRQNLRVGDGAVIGAGAVVVADVPAGVTVVGVPARPLRPAP